MTQGRCCLSERKGREKVCKQIWYVVPSHVYHMRINIQKLIIVSTSLSCNFETYPKKVNNALYKNYISKFPSQSGYVSYDHRLNIKSIICFQVDQSPEELSNSHVGKLCAME